MTHARTHIAAAIAATLTACQDPMEIDDLREAELADEALDVDAGAGLAECALADDELDGEFEPLDCATADPPAPADCGSCVIDWKTLRFPGSVSISPVVAAPYDPEQFPALYPPADKLPKLFEYDTKEKCEALGQEALFVRGKFWFTSDELPGDKRLLVIKPELLHTPKGIQWQEAACPAGVETVDYALKDYVTTDDLEDLEEPCLQGIVCPNSAGIYRNNDVARGWSCVSDSTWGTNLLNERIAVMCYPRAVDWDGYGPARGTTAKVFRVRESTPAPAYDWALVVEPPPEDAG
jgi:hypothetical protein